MTKLVFFLSWGVCSFYFISLYNYLNARHGTRSGFVTWVQDSFSSYKNPDLVPAYYVWCVLFPVALPITIVVLAFYAPGFIGGKLAERAGRLPRIPLPKAYVEDDEAP
jgi:hypothetical protein